MPVTENGTLPGSRTVTSTIAEIDSSRPYFLWVHYLDPHFPYAAPEPWRHRFVGDDHYDELLELTAAYVARRTASIRLW